MTHDELRKLAERATPGFWNWSRARTRQNLCANGSCFAQITMPAREHYQADAAYIAAARPEVIIGLLDEIASLQSTA